MPTNSLTPKQVEAAGFLASGSSHDRTARVIGTCKKTIDRWCKISEFQELIQSLRSSRFQTSIETIRAVDSDTASRLAQKALGAVESVLDNPDSRTADRLKAASLAATWVGLDAGRLVEQSRPGNLDREFRKKRIEQLMEKRRLIEKKLEGICEVEAG